MEHISTEYADEVSSQQLILEDAAEKIDCIQSWSMYDLKKAYDTIRDALTSTAGQKMDLGIHIKIESAQMDLDKIFTTRKM